MKNYNSKLKILHFTLPAPRLKRSFILLGSFCILIFSFCIFAANATNAATLYFSPSSGNFSVGDILSTSILVDTKGQEINNSEAVINFPANLLEVISINKSGSIFSLWVEEPVFSNSAGTISFNGGLPTPGFNGTAGKLVNIVFRIRNAGTASLIFSSAAVRANDGYGTDILKTRAQAQFNLISEEKSSPKEKSPSAPTVNTVPVAPQVSSSTHADSDKWISNKNPQFSWTLPANVNGVSVYLSQSPTSNPGPVSDGLFASKSYENVDDGVWYFHIRLRNNVGWSGASHFRFQIDTRPPEPFTVKFIDGNETENPRPTAAFDTVDSLSGIDYYKIKIGEGDFFSATPEIIKTNLYTLPFQDPGKRSILIQAFDKAGNYAMATEEFVIKSLKEPVFTEYPQELESGNILTVKGESQYPNSQVVIWLQREDDEPKNFSARSDQDGKFTFISGERLRDGAYKLWAEVIDERGAKSKPSEKLTIAVGRSAFMQAGTRAMSFLALVIPLVALIILLLALILYSWYKFSSFRKKIRKETKRAEKTLHQAFSALKEEIEEQVAKLDEKPDLSDREKKICDELKKALEISEKFIGKKIKNIKKRR